MPWCSRPAWAAGLSLGRNDAVPMACRSESCIVRYDKVEGFKLVLGILVRYGQGWSRLRRLKGFFFSFPFRRRDSSCHTNAAWVRADEAESPAEKIRFD